MGKTLTLLAGGVGVEGVAPFTQGAYTVITQTSPPKITAGRLAQLADATVSIVAEGPGTGTPSFVLGARSSERDTDRAVLVGADLFGGSLGAPSRLVLVGDNINVDVGATTQGDIVAIGGDQTWLADAGLSVVIGWATVMSGAVPHVATVLVGTGITSNGGDSVAVGHGSTTTNSAVAVGRATIAAQSSVAIGAGSRAGTESVRVGRTGSVVTSATQTVTLGASANAQGAGGIALGYNAQSVEAAAIVIGRNAGSIAANWLSIGNAVSSASWITNVIIGPSTEATYPGLSWQFTSTTIGANNSPAPNCTFNAGLSTGNATTGGRLIFTSGSVGASGTAYQAAASRFEIAVGGVAGTPSIRFVNQISTPGALAGTLGNSPVVGDPTVWMEVLINGALKYIPAW